MDRIAPWGRHKVRIVVLVYVNTVKTLVTSGEKAGASLSLIVSFVPCYFTSSFTATCDWRKDKKTSIIPVSEKTLLFSQVKLQLHSLSCICIACRTPQTNFSHVATLPPLNHVPERRGREVKAVTVDTGAGRDGGRMSKWPKSLFSQTHSHSQKLMQ